MMHECISGANPAADLGGGLALCIPSSLIHTPILRHFGSADLFRLATRARVARQARLGYAGRVAFDLEQDDRRYLWHPATHFADLQHTPPVPVVGASGSWLHEASGRRILDGVGSWWTSLHGHGHPDIVAAISAQAATLDHVMFAGFTHEPAVRLAKALITHAPAGLQRVFYTDCGSASVEAALKLSFQAHHQSGQKKRTRFATLVNSYHGETLGALSVGGHEGFRGVFGPLLFPPLVLPCPSQSDHVHEDLRGSLGADGPEADEAIKLLHAHQHELSALVVEPLLQAAGRMNMMGVGFYKRIVECAQSLGIHVIADEIAVAFGRTGRLFASTWAGVTPDFVCLSKGLSGGVLPLACVLIKEGIEEHFKGDPDRSFLHSHTFTANPIACAAGLASLSLLLDKGTLAALPEQIAAMNQERLAVAHACGPLIKHHRQIGFVAAFEVNAGGDKAPHRLARALRAAALKRDVLLRPLHDTVYWMPPLNISRDELGLLARATEGAIREVLA